MFYSSLVSPDGISDADYFGAVKRFLAQLQARGMPVVGPTETVTPAQTRRVWKIGDELTLSVDDSHVMRIRTAQLSHPDRAALARFANEAAEVLPMIDHYQLLDDWLNLEDDDHRIPAILAIGGPRPLDSDTFEAIADALDDEDPVVRHMTACGVAVTGCADFLPYLEDVLSREDHPQVADRIREAIAMIREVESARR